jgi:hypothetical protein
MQASTVYAMAKAQRCCALFRKSPLSIEKCVKSVYQNHESRLRSEDPMILHDGPVAK